MVLIKLDFERKRFGNHYFCSISISIEIGFDRARFRSSPIPIYHDFHLGHKSMLRLCFSESVRKMMQNGGRIVAIGAIFVLFPNFWNFIIILTEFGCKFVCSSFIFDGFYCSGYLALEIASGQLFFTLNHPGFLITGSGYRMLVEVLGVDATFFTPLPSHMGHCL